MIKAYLDWNVMTGLKNGRFSELNEIIRDTEKLLLPYSTAHIGDLFSSYNETAEQQKRIDSDLEFISRMTGDLCLFNTGKEIDIDYRDPKELFQQSIDDRYLTEDINLKGIEKSLTGNEPFPGAGKMMLDGLIPPTLESEFKAQLENPEVAKHIEKIFPGILANPTVEGLFNSFAGMINNLNEREGYKDLREIVQSGLGINRDQIVDSLDPFSIIDQKRKLIEWPKVYSGKSYAGPEWYNEIIHEYIELDMHGYQEDKVTISKGRKQTFNNTTQDAFHVAFATTCNFFVTNDGRSYKKAKKVYEKLHKNTVVMKPAEFVKYYKTYLDLEDDEMNWEILSGVLKDGKSVHSDENGVEMDIFVFPYFLFNFFNRIIIVRDSNEGFPTFLLSQNAPTHHFLRYVELQKLVILFNKLLGLDLAQIGGFKEDEITDGHWSGRQWKKGIMTVKLTITEDYVQIYLVFD